MIASLDESERPLDLTGEHKDPKSRFFWRMNRNELDPEKLPSDMDVTDKPEAKYAALKAPNVIPDAFKDVWTTKMEKWGNQMLTAVEDVNEMLSVGLGLAPERLNNLAT